MNVATFADTRADAELDAAVEAVRARRHEWADLPVLARIELVEDAMRGVMRVSDRWSTSCARAEGLEPWEPASAETALVGPYLVLRYLRILRRSLEGIERDGRPRIPGRIRTRPNGQTSVGVFPVDAWDRLLYLGVSGDVLMEPGVTPQEALERQALPYRQPDRGAVCLVLGGGNVSSIGPLDALHKLFVENRVVVLKLHPVLAFLRTILDEAFASLVREGYLRIVTGGAEEGAYLARHDGVDELHITGSHRTYDAIVFGPGEEGQRRKDQDRPVLDKPFSAELGNVTPVIVVPGPWKPADFRYHADNIATMLTNNAGFNCAAVRMLVNHAGWPGREDLLEALRRRLLAIGPRVAYYPGAEASLEPFLTAHPEAELIGKGTTERLPWTLIHGLDPNARDEISFGREAFCGLSGETRIEADSVAGYVDRAVAFANERLWGTLNATLIVHPASLREPAVVAAVERAIEGLRYGTVSVNHWSGLAFGLGVTPWGAFPGHTRTKIGSGTGTVHNPLMLAGVQKTVLRAPFRAWPKPPWFSSHRTALELAPELVGFEAAPSIRRLARIFALAVRG
jgi:acyl-CoA reductase-like NAD-dependent aldehyde dehydrogenase